MNNIEGIVILLTYLAVITSAISGALEARAYNMDVVGATTVAFVTAFGGGTLRDLLLGRTPIFWLIDPWLSVVTFTIAIFSFYGINRISVYLLFVPDALSLGFFSVLGSTFALQMELSLLSASLMGVVTGVFGGVYVMCSVIKSQISFSAILNFMQPVLLSESGSSSFSSNWAQTRPQRHGLVLL